MYTYIYIYCSWGVCEGTSTDGTRAKGHFCAYPMCFRASLFVLAYFYGQFTD